MSANPAAQPAPDQTAALAGFDLFWSRYPNKFNRAQARAVWEHLEPTPAQEEALLGALTLELGARARCGGRTIATPTAAIWLLEHQHFVDVETVPTAAARTRRSAWLPALPPEHASTGRRMAARAAQAAFTVAFPVTLAAMAVHGWTAP